MLYYSFADIMRSHDISKSALRKMVDSGRLIAQKLIVSRDNPNCFKYIIPETELLKLAKFRFCDPVPSADAQPSHYQECWRRYDERLKAREEKEHKPAKIPYYDYLHSDEYRAKRFQALKQDGYRCQMCGTAKNLRVHQNSARIPLALAMGRKRVISFLFSFSPISKIFSEI